MHIWPINQIPWPHKLPHPETSTPTHTHICWHTPLLWETESPTAAARAGGWGRGKVRGMGRIWVCHVNNSQVARAGGHSVINVPPHSQHLTRGCIPGVMGSSWTEVSGSTAENKLGRPWGNTHNYLPSESQTCSLPALRSAPTREIISDLLFIEVCLQSVWWFCLQIHQQFSPSLIWKRWFICRVTEEDNRTEMQSKCLIKCL